MICKQITSAILAVSLLAGCADMQGVGTKQGFGTLGGAAAGGLLGAQAGKGSGNLAMTALGTIAGALLGNSVGKSLDKADSIYADRALQQASRGKSGKRYRWRDRDAGMSGEYVPLTDPRRTDDGYCREFQQHVVVGGRSEKAYGTACRQPDGTWQIIG